MAADGSVVIEITADDSSAESKLKNLGNVAGAALKGITVAAAAAGAAVIALGTQSIEAYADYEQLVGGVETLFKDSAGIVGEYAANAYKTAGISANTYMETVTSFSASLLQSLGGDTDAAAKVADMAITDMADNANKMGTSMDAIQVAYQGFAKANYTMLDNLKLGYGGTKGEMERLLADAEKLSGQKYDISNLNDVYEAIHVVQTELGITGTTAKEASTTIQGSASSMKGAWENLLVGLADDTQDFDGLLEDLIDSVGTFAENLIPRIEIALGGIAKLASKLAPQIAAMLPGLASDLLPKITEIAVSIVQNLLDGLTSSLPQLAAGAVSIFTTLVNGLTTLLPQLAVTAVQLLTVLANGITKALPTLIPAAVGAITALVQGLVDNIPALIPAAVDAIAALVQGLIDNIPALIDAALQLILGLVDGIIAAIPVLLEAIPTVITSLVTGLLEAIPSIIEAGVQLLTALVTALPEIIAAIVAVLPQIIDGIVTALLDNLPLIVQAGIDLLVALIQALPTIITTIVTALPQIITSIVDALVGNIPAIVDAGVQLFVALIENLPTIIVEIVKAVPQIVAGIVDGFSSLAGEIVDIGKNIVSGVWEGIVSMTSWVKDKVTGFFGGIVDGVKDFLGIHSPSKVFAEIAGYTMEGFADGFESGVVDSRKRILSAAAGLSEELAGAFTEQAYSPEFHAQLAAQMQAAVDAETNKVSFNAATQAEGKAANSGMTHEVYKSTNTIEKVARIEGDGVTGELVRMLGLKLKDEDNRVGDSLED